MLTKYKIKLLPNLKKELALYDKVRLKKDVNIITKIKENLTLKVIKFRIIILNKIY